jgi:hypothetical protein
MAGAKMKKYSKKASKKVGKVMKEYYAGSLKSSSGSKVTSPAQAKAIALSEARAKGYKVPSKKKKKRSYSSSAVSKARSSLA